MRRYGFLVVMLTLLLSLAANAYAVTYYVKPNGNDNLDGRTDATAWRSISKVNSYKFQTGDDVYFKCGGTWNINDTSGNGLTVDWSGTSANEAVIGAYYMNGSAPVIGVSGKKPVFAGTKPLDWTNAVQTYQNNALIYVTGRNHVTIQDIRATNTMGHAFNLINGSNYKCIGLEAYNAYNTGIRWARVDTGLIERCDVSNVGTKAIESPGTNWPASIAVNNNSHDIAVRKNKVYNNYGEGIGFYHLNYDSTVECNICYGNRRTGIYVDRGKNFQIRYNLVYGTPGRGPDSTGSDGIGIASEHDRFPTLMENNKIYGNLVAAAGYRGIFMSTGEASLQAMNNDVYNNTVIDSRGSNYSFASLPSYSNSNVKNNISWCISSDCRQAATPGKPGLTFDYNLWSSSPATGARGSHDPGYAAPKLAKTSGWRAVTGGVLTGAEFALSVGSPAIDSGLTIGADYKFILECGQDITGSQTPTVDQGTQGSRWEIGADVFVIKPVGTLAPPTDLRVVSSQ